LALDEDGQEEKEYLIGGRFNDTTEDTLEDPSEVPWWRTLAFEAKLKGGGYPAASVAAFLAICFVLTASCFLIQAGGRGLMDKDRQSNEYKLAGAGLAIGAVLFFVCLLNLLGLWRLEDDTQLAQWGYWLFMWLLLFLVAHGVAIIRYWASESTNPLLTNPEHDANKFWFECTDLVAIVGLLMNLVSLMYNDALDVFPNSMKLCSLFHLLGGAAMFTLDLLVTLGKLGDKGEVTWPHEWPIYVTMGVGGALVLLGFIGVISPRQPQNHTQAKCHNAILIMLYYLLIPVAILSLFVGIVVLRGTHSEPIELSAMVACALPLFTLLLWLSVSSLRKESEAKLAVNHRRLIEEFM